MLKPSAEESAAKCAYRGDRIWEIEENVTKKKHLDDLLSRLGEKANCRFDAIPGREFCIFHDPNYWRENPDEVQKEFLNHLKEDEERFFVGFHLPRVELPNVVEKEVHMELAKFHDSLSVSTTVFKEKAWFNGATFEGWASFIGATFKEDAWFDSATFERVAWFDRVTFEGWAWFDRATFKEALFDRATFKKASFDRATFKGDAQFYEAIFLGATLFDWSVFSGQVIFRNSFFLPDLLDNCLDPYNHISFRNVSFEGLGKVIFDGCFMRRVSFIGTDLGRIEFRNVGWGEGFKVFDEKLFLIKIGKGRKAFLRECEEKLKRILDVLNGNKKDEEIEREINLEPSIYEVLTNLKNLREKDGEKSEELKRKLEELKDELRKRIDERIDELKERRKQDKIFEKVEGDDGLTLENVLAVYRGLRDNYDYYLRYEESGRFFINEMRLRRVVGKGYGEEKHSGLEMVKRKLSGFAEKFVMWVYEILALYGESYSRPILWAILLIILSALIRPLWLWMQNPNWMPEPSFIFKEMKTSILVFFQLYWDTRTLTIIERLLSIPILGVLVLALKRKLERRVRH